jgi:hypothetical protein
MTITRVKIITGVITPFPITSFMENTRDNNAIRYMFPMGGKITLGTAYFEDMPEIGVDIHIDIYRGDEINSTVLFTNKKYFLIEPDTEVLAGDRLSVSVVPRGEADLENIWLSFLWVPKTKDAEIKQFVLTELEQEE